MSILGAFIIGWALALAFLAGTVYEGGANKVGVGMFVASVLIMTGGTTLIVLGNS